MRKYKRKTNRQSWDELSMGKAVQAVVIEGSPYKTAARNYNVDRNTLKRRVKLYRECPDLEIAMMKGLGSRLTVFSPLQEVELAEYLKAQALRLEGLTRQELKVLAYQVAEKNGLKHPFTNGAAGDDWVNAFFKRVGTLSLRTPEAVSAARASGFNEVVVNGFFELLEHEYNLYDTIGILNAGERFPPERIFNVDETGTTTNGKKLQRIIAPKGTKQVGKRVASDRGKNITVELCISASGQVLPPVFIFPRVNMQSYLLNGGLEGSWGMANPSGWINVELFFRWFKWFVSFVKPTAANPVLLILDGHNSRMNLELLEYAREHYVTILCLPPHTTHRLQPLDVGVMKPFSTYFSQEIDEWRRQNPGRVVTEDLICLFTAKALPRAATRETVTNSFRTTGIYPLNKNIFNNDDFAPAAVTDRPKSLAPDYCSSEEEYEVLEKTLSELSIQNVSADEINLSQSDGTPSLIGTSLQNNLEAHDEREPVAHSSSMKPGSRPQREAFFRPSVIDSSSSDLSENELLLTSHNPPQVVGHTFAQRKAVKDQTLSIPPMEILPLAVAPLNQLKKRGRPRGKAAVLTCPSVRRELKEKKEEAQKKEEKKRKRLEARESNKAKKSNPPKRRKTRETEEDSDY